MSKDEGNAAGNGSQAAEAPDEKMKALVGAVRHNGLVALRAYFGEADGDVMGHKTYGPIFVFKVKNEAGDFYACGFFLRELVAKFQKSGDEAAEWMASFYYEMMKTRGGKLLPKPPQTEDEAKALIDKVLVPQCISAVNEEFAPEKVYAGLNFNGQVGPVLEAGFPAIPDGNNTFAVPLHVLNVHLLLNRDPSELMIQGLYKIREEHGLA